MFVEIVTIATFIVISTSIALIGQYIVAARQRAESIADIELYSSSNRQPGQLKRAIAGAIPQFSSEVKTIDQDLKRAGYYSPWALVEYMATRNTLFVGLLILTGSMAVLADPNSELPKLVLLTGVLTALFGYGIPRLFLKLQANRRVDRIQRGLPDALDMIRMCVTGGMPLRFAMQRVAEEIEFFHPDIAVEFEVVRRHADADTLQRALKRFAQRINTPDVNALASLVGQSDRIGTSVVTAITEYADGVRRAYKQRAEERANKSSIKMLFPVVLCLAPAVFILILGPPVLKLSNFLNEGRAPGGILNNRSVLIEELDTATSVNPTATRSR